MIRLAVAAVLTGALTLLPGADARAPFSAEELVLVRQILKHNYDLDYEVAAELCRTRIDAAPGDPLGYSYLARTRWVQHLNRQGALSLFPYSASDFFANPARYAVDIDLASEREFRQISRQAIETAKTLLKQAPDDLRAKYLLGLAYQNLATFDATVKHSWWSTVMNGERTVKLHRDVQEAMPDFRDAGLAVAMYHYVAASVPWRLRWFTVLIGRTGSKERGKQELEEVARGALLAADDARTLLAVLYTRDGEHEKALEKVRELSERYPRSYLLRLEIGNIFLRMGKPAEAVRAYEQVLHMVQTNTYDYRRLEAGIVQTRLGLAHRAAGNLTLAEQEFRAAADDPSSSERTRTEGRLELGKTLDLLGHRAGALEQYRLLAASAGSAAARREAASLLKKPYRN
jgi:tetratricopeptide (TPR) repeat protein